MIVTYAYKSAEGSVYLTTGSPKPQIEYIFGKELTDEEYKEIIKASCQPAEGCDVIEVNPEDLPDDDLFPCWEIDGNKIRINFDKLRDWGLKRIRSLREPAFKDLDLKVTRALEDGDTETLENVKLTKNKLRNITEEIKSLTCPNGKFACQTTLAKFRELIDKSRIEGIVNGEADK